MFSIQKSSHATSVGLIAILLWSTTVALIRSVTEQMGLIGGAAILYTISAITLLLVVGTKSWKTMPRFYMLFGCILFVVYELCLSISIGMATTRSQVIEVGMLNYLWPSLTTLLALFMNKERAKWWIVIGLALALFGVVVVLSGDRGISLEQIHDNITSNPWSYALAAAGALIWAFYCNVTKRYANGHNGVVLFTLMTAVALWVMYFADGASPIHVNVRTAIEVLISGIAMGAAYGCWNVGILKGNLVLLATASYFTPVLSTLFAAFFLNIDLTMTFMQGVLFVTLGSLVCWYATRVKMPIKSVTA